jgi:hypothetical protein
MKRLLFTFVFAVAAIVIAAIPIPAHADKNCSTSGADMFLFLEDNETIFIIRDKTVTACHVEIERRNFILLPDGNMLLAVERVPVLNEPFKGGLEGVRLLEFLWMDHAITRFNRIVPNAIAIYIAVAETEEPELIHDYPFWIAFDRNRDGCIEYGELWKNRSPDPKNPRYELVTPDSSCHDQEFGIPPFMRY